ncbi:hypothetical protein O1W71_02080 [Microbacterium sp. H37-C3]|uniref:hypothetical protein n=1 Tax=Microbacterium sp. H37-C3 TaxID=3004354 RepID=UPI0022AFA219|nr:hypothetical protein [Microbacterium sp. H37-C3]MCZ4066456.1 hypothetical protein [Microbacterium sp. H37-C3]
MSDDVMGALAARLHQIRDEQRARDNEPCAKCGGDRLRNDFTGSGRCHAARAHTGSTEQDTQ